MPPAPAPTPATQPPASPGSASAPAWPEPFAGERARLLAALGALTAGGIVEAIEHVGATSVPALAGAPGPVDIALAVWPFPLEAERVAALRALGYDPVPGFEGPPEQRFRHRDGGFQLMLVIPGSEHWLNYRLIRDFLRHDPAAREAYAAAWQPPGSVDRPAAKERLFGQLLPPARAWWIAEHGFAPVEAVARELDGFGRPWLIAGGWALDLCLGRVTRVHQDVDVVVDKGDQQRLREHLDPRGWKFVTPLAGRLEPWPPHMRLELPRHQAHAHRDGQFIDFQLSDIASGVWYYRRNPAIVRIMDRARMSTSAGLPFLAPELVLLFKSKNTGDQPRGHDQTDYERVLPQLEPERRAWLRWALIASDPGQAWIDQLG